MSGESEAVQAAREETLRLAAKWLVTKYGVTSRAARDLTRLAELEAQGRSVLWSEQVTPVECRYDPGCPLPRPHGHHWNGLGTMYERECHGERRS